MFRERPDKPEGAFLRNVPSSYRVLTKNTGVAEGH